MKSRTLLLALAGASLIAGGQAIAQGRGGGHGGGHGGGMGMGQGGGHGMGQRGGIELRGQGRIDVGVDRGRERGVETRTEARVRSRAPERASDRAIERANENSVLSGTARPPRADLSGLRAGLTVRNSAGVELGTIRRVNRSSDGTVRSVLVASAEGQRTIPVRPGTLSISGDVVTTTQVQPPR
ncbi:MAG: hypothetical protein ACT4N8_14785 [Sphingosinicella sp.]|uniref:hypothetical protein n=1 Tax=Sphingosinicella sp. TaxID=1917971 RepID=UPI0040383279